VELVPFQRTNYFLLKTLLYLKSLKQVVKALFKTKNNRNIVAAFHLSNNLIMINFYPLFFFPIRTFMRVFSLFIYFIDQASTKTYNISRTKLT